MGLLQAASCNARAVLVGERRWRRRHLEGLGDRLLQLAEEGAALVGVGAHQHAQQPHPARPHHLELLHQPKRPLHPPLHA
eukprot:2097243-Rhodomonas_salina.1